MCAKVGFHGLITAIRNGGYRRVSPVAPRPREGPLTEPTAGARPWQRERVLVPHTCRSQHPLGGFSWVESRCGAVAVGRACLFPPLSCGGALVARP